jgi:hypothetical protein
VRQESRFFRVEPAVLPPATRLYNARGLDVANGLPVLPAGQSWQVQNDQSIKNIGAAAVATFRWTGGGWVPSDTIAPGAQLTAGDAATLVTTDGSDLGPPSNRPADFSPDGVNSFADYIASRVVRRFNGSAVNDGVLIASAFTLDSNGDPGDPNDASAVLYHSPFREPMSPLFFGRLQLEVFTDEDPPAAYVPRLVPFRVIHLAAKALAQAANALVPDQAVLTVPALNVESAQLLVGSSNGTVIACLGNPLPELEGIGQACAVRTQGDGTEPPASAAVGTVDAALMEDNNGDFIQVIAGGAGNVATLASGSKLVLKRRVC